MSRKTKGKEAERKYERMNKRTKGKYSRDKK
jgi:hypothetical protein